MRKKLIFILSAAICAAMIAGCSSDIRNEADEERPSEVVSTEAPSTAPVSADPDAEYEYEVKEIWVDNDGEKIYGEAYIPIADGKSPLVIHSHGLGTNHEAGASYGKKYARRGIAVYTMDFRGGSNSNHENRSDGETTEMSVLTEASDLSAALKAAKTWDFVDKDRIFLQGGSQGGLVTAIAGVEHEDEIAGLILHYPAFGMYYIMEGADDSELPETYDFGNITVGKIFWQDLNRYDVREDLQYFEKPVLVLQGGDDEIVPPFLTEDVIQSYPNYEYRIIEGAGHGFSGEKHDEATKYAVDFIYKTLGK